jgi:hypothetical protein
MKKLILLAAVLASLAVVAVAPPVTELTVATQTNQDLNATSVRITMSAFHMDRTCTLNAEARNTGGTIIDRQKLAMTAAQVKTWIDDADPDAWVKAYVLTAMGLTAE